MKRALCVKNDEVSKNFFTNQTETIQAQFVSREICESVDSGLLQIIPYISIFAYNYEEGRLVFLKYTRPNTSGEERLKDKVSIGLGGHIDQDEEMSYMTKTDDESPIYTLDKMSMNKTVLAAAKRELKEELPGIPDSIINHLDVCVENTMVFSDQSNDVGKVHLCCLIPVEIDMATLGSLLNENIINKEEIGSIGVISVNIGSVIEDFNIDKSMNAMNTELNNEMDIESWSSISINIISNAIMSHLINSFTYADLKYVLDTKKQLEDVTSAGETGISSGAESGQQEPVTLQ